MLCILNVARRDSPQTYICAREASVHWGMNNCLESHYIRVPIFRSLRESNVAESRTDANANTTPIERCEGVFQAHTELTNYSSWVLQFLLAFVLCQMFVL